MLFLGIIFERCRQRFDNNFVSATWWMTFNFFVFCAIQNWHLDTVIDSLMLANIDDYLCVSFSVALAAGNRNEANDEELADATVCQRQRRQLTIRHERLFGSKRMKTPRDQERMRFFRDTNLSRSVYACNAIQPASDDKRNKKNRSPEFGCPLLFGRADGAPSRASTSSAYAPCFSRSNTIFVNISPLCRLISKNSLPSFRGESTM